MHCFLVGHITKGIRKANIWPKMTKNAYFGPNLPVFWAKILFFLAREQKFWYANIRKIIAPIWTRKTNIRPTMTKMVILWPNLALFWPKIHFLGGGSKTFGTLRSGNLLDTSFVLKILTGEAPMGR